MTLLVLLALAQDTSYVDKKYGLSFSIPSKEWGVLRADKFELKWPGARCEIADVEGNIGGCLAVEESGKTAEKYADFFEQSMAKASKGFKRTRSEPAGEAIRREFTLQYDEYTYRYVCLFGTRDRANWKFCVWVAEPLWEEKRKEIESIVASFTWETLLPNPWKGCGKGSWAKYRKTGGEVLYVLVDQDAESYTMRVDAAEPTKVSLRQKVDATTKVESGEETLKVPKGEFKCRWTKTAAGQVWTCDDVPFRMVKSVSGTTTLELLDFERK